VSEFTGERVIPGEVNPDLWAEHLARYLFAARYAAGRRVLDIGCGTGYGTAELAARAAQATGVDNSPEALVYARDHFTAPNLTFLDGAAVALPVADSSFDLVVAFEVIEHLDNWRTLLTEAKRVLAPSGLFIVSTPNTLYYSESRGSSGPNPFHVHEFEFAEFSQELRAEFGTVAVLAQNRTECFAFQDWQTGGAAAGFAQSGAGNPDEAHFFIALCGALPASPSFIYVPSGTNLLRERERHIALLEGQLAELLAERKTLIEVTDRQKNEIEERNQWAQKLDSLHKQALARISRLQEELHAAEGAARRMADGYNAKIVELEQENDSHAQWVHDTERRLEAESAELAKCVGLLDRAEATVIERTQWAQRTDEELRRCQAILQAIRASRWVKLAKMAGLGPKL
jgi:SAM-dependent methyltransferase